MSARRPQPRTLHAKIRSTIERSIATGAWRPGHQVPSEAQLAERFGCSRMTVNKVLAELARAGLLHRRRRRGTIVAEPGAPSAMLPIPDLEAEVVARGSAYRYELLARRNRLATAAERALLGLPRPTPVAVLRTLHLADEQGWALEDRLINLDAVPDAATAPFDVVVPGSWLRAHVPWTEAEHRIRAAAADARVAHALGVPIGSALLVMERRTWRTGTPVTHVVQRFPAVAHELVARFAPAARRAEGDASGG